MTVPHKIVVGSRNPVKVECVKQAFEAVWPGESFLVEGVPAESGVAEQPLNEEETIAGARHRAQEALAFENARFGVGLEGGLVYSAGRWMECGWVVVLDQRTVREGIAATAKIIIPEQFQKQMQAGETLSDLCDRAFGLTSVGQDVGYFGLMTNNAVTRTSAYRDAVAFALAMFVQPQLFQRTPGVVGE